MKPRLRYCLSCAIAILPLLYSCGNTHKSTENSINENGKQTTADTQLKLYCDTLSTFVQTTINATDTIYGCVFGKDCDIQTPFNYSDRFTPSETEIAQVEKMIADNFQQVIEDCRYRTDSDAISSSSDNLLYFRQYAGYIANDGSKRIFVNCIKFYSPQDISNISEYTDLFLVNDGGASFWEATVNITDSTLLDISVHGLG